MPPASSSDDEADEEVASARIIGIPENVDSSGVGGSRQRRTSPHPGTPVRRQRSGSFGIGASPRMRPSGGTSGGGLGQSSSSPQTTPTSLAFPSFSPSASTTSPVSDALTPQRRQRLLGMSRSSYLERRRRRIWTARRLFRRALIVGAVVATMCAAVSTLRSINEEAARFSYSVRRSGDGPSSGGSRSYYSPPYVPRKLGDDEPIGGSSSSRAVGFGGGGGGDAARVEEGEEASAHHPAVDETEIFRRVLDRARENRRKCRDGDKAKDPEEDGETKEKGAGATVARPEPREAGEASAVTSAGVADAAAAAAGVAEKSAQAKELSSPKASAREGVSDNVEEVAESRRQRRRRLAASSGGNDKIKGGLREKEAEVEEEEEEEGSDEDVIPDSDSETKDGTEHSPAKTAMVATVLAMSGGGRGSKATPKPSLHSELVPLSVFEAEKRAESEAAAEATEAGKEGTAATQSERRPRLEPFGIIDALTKTTVPVADQGSGSAKDALGTEGCRLPPTSSCHLRRYTALVASPSHLRSVRDPSRSMRVLFMNVFKLLSFSSVREIVVIYEGGGGRRDMEDDRRYGRRLLSWNDDDSHAVRAVFAEDRSDKGGALLAELDPNVVGHTSEAMLRVDGTVPLRATDDDVEAAFDAWRRDSLSAVWVGRGDDNLRGSTPAEKEGGASDRNDAAHGADASKAADDSKGSSSSSENALVSFCPAENIDASNNDVGTGIDGTSGASSSAAVSSAHFLHRDYLCLLSHPTFGPLRALLHQKRDSDLLDADAYRTAEATLVSSLISQLGGRPPVLARASSKARRREREARKRRRRRRLDRRNAVGNGIGVGAGAAMGARKVLSSLGFGNGGGVQNSQTYDDYHHDEEARLPSLWTYESAEWSDLTGSLGEDLRTELAGYFGSAPFPEAEVAVERGEVGVIGGAAGAGSRRADGKGQEACRR